MQIQFLYPLIALVLFGFFWSFDLADHVGWRTAAVLGTSRAPFALGLAIALGFAPSVISSPYETAISVLPFALLLLAAALGWQWWASRPSRTTPSSEKNFVRGQLMGGHALPGLLLFAAFPVIGFALTWLRPLPAIAACSILSSISRSVDRWAWRRATPRIDRKGVDVGARRFAWSQLNTSLDGRLQVLRIRPTGSPIPLALRFDALDSAKVLDTLSEAEKAEAPGPSPPMPPAVSRSAWDGPVSTT